MLLGVADSSVTTSNKLVGEIFFLLRCICYSLIGPSNYLTVSAIKCVPVGYGLVLCRLALHTQDKMHNITKTAKFYFTSTGSRSVTSRITKAVKSSGLSSFSALIFSLVGE